METKNAVNQYADFAAAVINCLPQFLAPGKMDNYIQNQQLLKKDLDEALNPEMVYRDVLDYSIPFEELVHKGNYYSVEEGINEENFATKSGSSKKNVTKKVVFKVVSFEEEKGTDEVLSYFKEQNIRLATPYETVYFGCLHPELQKKLMIQCLTTGNKSLFPRNCLCLSYHPKDDQRILTMAYYYNSQRRMERGFLGIYE